MQQRTKKFLPALEGVRGYLFLVVFLLHYNKIEVRPAELWLWPYFLLTGMGWLVVPVFFVLSGYLITGILYDSKGREGYFKVFYTRRALRVFPLYYLVLAAIALFAWSRHWAWAWNVRYLSFFFYAQNFTNTGRIFLLGNFISVGHLWSLAVEEHFYLLWPVVIWLCPNRRSMLNACYAMLVACFAIRLCWPFFHVSMMAGYWSTFTRADAIALGAICVLVERGEGLPRGLTRWCGWGAAAAVAVVAARTVLTGSSTPVDYTNLVWMTPLVNLLAACLLVLLLDRETLLNRVCSAPWICRLGRIAYGMYLFHSLYIRFFSQVLAPRLRPVLGQVMAQAVSACLAYALTWSLARLSYRFLEEPAMRAKEIVVYGPMRPQVLAPSGSSRPAWLIVPRWNTVKVSRHRVQGRF